jgi:glycosyltransferase involved in cell wall biosynthesis
MVYGSPKKKVVLIGPAHPLRGGLASYNERLARAFQEDGHQISIYTFSLQYPGFLFPGTTQYSTEPAPTDLDIQVKINSVSPWNWWNVGQALKKQKPDLVVVRYWLPFMGPCLGTILRIIRKNKHTRIVCIADNIIPHEKRPGDQLFTRYFIKSVDAFITMSEKVLSDLKIFARNKPARYIPHPLYDNFGEPMPARSAREILQINVDVPLVLFFGFIRKYKGLDLLFEAIHRLNILQPGHPYRFLIAGEFYEDRKPYDELIEKLQIQDQLILHTDFIPDSSVKTYLCAADVVIQPYRSATQSGVTPLAYHFEVPMIVTNVGGLPALVPNGKVGLVTEPDPDALANAIIEYFKLGKAHFMDGLREEKKKYSWEIMVDALLNS